MNDSAQQFYHLRSFEDLLYDAVYMLYLAQDVDVEKERDCVEVTYTRASVLNTLLLFECGANCCIDALNLRGSFAEDIDKLPFLSKYELFLNRTKPESEFDRGCREVQAVAELKAVRDGYVHPKVKRQPYSKDDDLSADFGETSLLKFPRDAGRWNPGHALLALKSANDFFNAFFLSWCLFDTDTVCEILLSSDEASIPARSSTFIDAIGGLDRAVRDYKIDFKFIGKRI